MSFSYQLWSKESNDFLQQSSIEQDKQHRIREDKELLGLGDAAAAAKSLQSCLTLCDSIDGSPPGSPVPGILQARTLEWVAISFSNAWKWKVKVKSLSCVRLLVTPGTAAYQAPPSMGFSRQEYWSGVPLTSPQRTLGRILKKMHTQGLIFNINYYFFYCFIESILTWNFFFFLNWVHGA